MAELREKNAREIELTEAVAARFLKWSKLVGGIAAGLVLLFVVLFGKSYSDFHQAVVDGESQIGRNVSDGVHQIGASVDAAKSTISGAQTSIPGIDRDISQLQSDVAKYKAVDQHIDKLQSDVTGLQHDVVDLGHKTLKASVLQATGPGASLFSFGKTGCFPPDPSFKALISLCAEGSPLMFSSETPDGEARPIASFSDIGFQDLSRSPRPECDQKHRGTIYIQKGKAHQADRPFVCIKDASDAYNWLALAGAN